MVKKILTSHLVILIKFYLLEKCHTMTFEKIQSEKNFLSYFVTHIYCRLGYLGSELNQ